MNQEILIGNRKISAESPAFIIAELSGNHNQDLGRALAIIEAAGESGADAIKLQTYTADTITMDCRNQYFAMQTGTLWKGRILYDLYQEAHTPWSWHDKLFQKAEESGLICFSSPFDKTAVDFLEQLNAPAYKIASYEINDIPLTGRPDRQACDNLHRDCCAVRHRAGAANLQGGRKSGCNSFEMHIGISCALPGNESEGASPYGGDISMYDRAV